jgi:hypothetical protein
MSHTNSLDESVTVSNEVLAIMVDLRQLEIKLVQTIQQQFATKMEKGSHGCPFLVH